MHRLFLGGCALALSVLAAPARAQTPTVYIACDDHTDYFWTADDVAYRKAFVRSLDYYLDQVDRTANDPPDFQARFACDGALWLWEYERHRPHSDFLRLITRMKDGHISAPMTAAVSCYGGMPVEAAARHVLRRPAERRFGLRFDLAVAMENQTLPYGSRRCGPARARATRGGASATARRRSRTRGTASTTPTGREAPTARVLMKWNSMLVSNEAMGATPRRATPSRSSTP
jgi:alpha-mannosidase